jgi:hypothetical protein
LRGTYDELAQAFQKLVDEYVERKYAKSQEAGKPGSREA